MSQFLGALAVAGFTAAYFILPYYMLRRGRIIVGGLAMLAVAIAGMALVAISGDSPGGGVLFFISLPLPLILILVGTIVAIVDRVRGSRASS